MYSATLAPEKAGPPVEAAGKVKVRSERRRVRRGGEGEVAEREGTSIGVSSQDVVEKREEKRVWKAGKGS